ncbi:unnamed protein product [Cyprideis torosa]|uniref:Uncharacterized protein n=1 Tax=Cyprideis torosa TaxID=163714 RepID=A0A7R8ZVQ7_9CRUS|nr:unnamed protein product [Cyprideis torosa]CAG0903825.1 unnamed protein product [Cyprideis torosa]
MQTIIRSKLENLEDGNRLTFRDLIRNNRMRKQVAQKFYTLLILKKQQVVEVDQPVPFEDIYISRGLNLG